MKKSDWKRNRPPEPMYLAKDWDEICPICKYVLPNFRSGPGFECSLTGKGTRDHWSCQKFEFRYKRWSLAVMEGRKG